MSDQPSLFDVPEATPAPPPPPPRQPYGGSAPARDSDTSRAAAARVSPRRHELQETVLGFVRNAGEQGVTAEEAGGLLADLRGESDRYAYSTRSTAAARLTELKLLGMIRDSGRRRKNRSGASAAVWVACSLPPSAPATAAGEAPATAPTTPAPTPTTSRPAMRWA